MEKTLNVLIGVLGVSGQELADQLPGNFDYNEIIKLSLQVIIAICTIIALFRKQKNK